ncbi:MAG: hypothetical protein KIC67_15245 [Clostridium butyricum]|nr:hypothetical protein [Clostridium butyricum]
MIKFVKKNWFAIFVVCLFIIKILIVNGLPIFALGETIHDDRLMVDNSISLMNGQWLGNYNERTLVKGIFFPLFLSLIYKLNISYTVAVSTLYGIACIVFIIAINTMIKNKKILAVIYAVLLFCPVSYCRDAFQRVYRNSISPAQVIFIIACFIGMYTRKYESTKKYAMWSISAGLTFICMWHNREDGIWILPFVIVSIIITIICVWKKYINERKYAIRKSIIAIVPLIMVVISSNFICAINYKYYGIYTTNELLNSNFTKAYKSMLSVEPEEKIKFISIPHSTVEKLYKVSPTFKELKPLIENSGWDKFGHYGTDGNIEDGWFFWALREAVYRTIDKKDAASINEFYLKIYNEIEEGFKNGTLKRRKTFSSPLMTPWDNSYFKPLIKQLVDSFNIVASYTNMEPKVDESIGQDNSIQLFEIVTNNQAIKPKKVNFNLEGWAFTKDEHDNFEVKILDSNKAVIENVAFSNSEDVFEHFKSLDNKQYDNAKKCRFNISINIENEVMPFYMQIINNDVVEEIKIDKNSLTGENELYCYNIDKVEYNETTDMNLEYKQHKTVLINLLTNIYKNTGMLLVICGVISYIVIIIRFIYSAKAKKYYLKDEFLIITGILGSLSILIGGVSYTNISAYDAINIAYLSATYPLIIMFWALSIGVIFQYILDKKNRNRK